MHALTRATVHTNTDIVYRRPEFSLYIGAATDTKQLQNRVTKNSQNYITVPDRLLNRVICLVLCFSVDSRSHQYGDR